MRDSGSVGDPAIVNARPDRAWIDATKAVKGVSTWSRRPAGRSMVASRATPCERIWQTMRRSDSKA